MKKISTWLICLAIVAATAFPALAAVGTVNTESTGLNVRSSPSTNASVVSSLAKGSYINVADEQSGWYKVEYAPGAYGWSSGKYIGLLDTAVKYVATVSGRLNVRSGAGMTYSVVSTLAKGAKVEIISENGGWAKIIYGGTKTGYVSAAFLSDKNPTTQSPVSNNTGVITLSVPLYSQTDSRWRYDYLGYSSKTIGSSGCTTTCIAMAESYLRGYTVYPDAMEDELSYSYSGDLYWPSGYTAYFTDYYTKILSELKAGRPVLVGAKTYSGGQHWVVVTGYTGGSLTASSFVINDPGTASRKTLSEFFSAFPVFYKIVTVR